MVGERYRVNVEHINGENVFGVYDTFLYRMATGIEPFENYEDADSRAKDMNKQPDASLAEYITRWC